MKDARPAILALLLCLFAWQPALGTTPAARRDGAAGAPAPRAAHTADTAIAAAGSAATGGAMYPGTMMIALAADSVSYPEAVPESPPKTYKKKNPLLALLFSTVLPSSGQFYNGETEKGAVMVALLSGGVVLHLMQDEPGNKESLGDTGLVIVAITWMWSMLDAPISAQRINEKNRLAAGVSSVPARRWDVFGTVSSRFDTGRAGFLVRF